MMNNSTQSRCVIISSKWTELGLAEAFLSRGLADLVSDRLGLE